MDQCSVQGLIVPARMTSDRVLAFSFCDPDFKVTKLSRLSLQDNIPFDTRLFRISICDFQATQALERVVPDDRCT